MKKINFIPVFIITFTMIFLPFMVKSSGCPSDPTPGPLCWTGGLCFTMPEEGGGYGLQCLRGISSTEFDCWVGFPCTIE